MSNEDERLAKLADMMREEISSLPNNEGEIAKPGIRIKGNSANINFGTQLTLADQTERAESRKLVSAQRQELYELGVRCEELGADSKVLWRQVFAQLGVTRIDDITTEQFHPARGVLQAKLDQLQEDADKRRLIGKILRAADEKDAKSEMNNFCDITFGRTHLNDLKRSELQRVLEFIQGFQVKSPAPPQPESAQPGQLALREFLITYKANAAGLFVCGFIVGTLWF